MEKKNKSDIKKQYSGNGDGHNKTMRIITK